MKKVTIAECKRTLLQRGEKLPRCGYETYVTTRKYESYVKVYNYDGKLDLPSCGTRIIIEIVYLMNNGGRLSVRYSYPINENW